MFVRKLEDCGEFIAGDATLLRELFHPDKTDVRVRYSLAHALGRPGQTSQPHKLKTSGVYYILRGEGIMHVDGEEQRVSSNDVIYIPPDATQYIENTGQTNLRFLCIVDPAWRPQDEEIAA